MAAISGTSVRLAYREETTPGTTPGDNLFKVLRSTGKNVNLKFDPIQSAEVRSSRQQVDLRQGLNRVEGDIGTELSLGPYDDMIRFAMSGSTTGSTPNWFTPTNTGFTGTDVRVFSIDVTSATAKMAVIRGTGSNAVDLGFRPGDWIELDNWTTTAHDGRWRIVTVSGTDITIETGSLSFTVEVGVGGGSPTSLAYVGSKMVINGSNGSKLQTFSLEREFADTTNPVYELFKGCAVNTWAVSMRPDGIISSTFGILGMSADIDRTTSADADGYTPFTPTAVLPMTPLAGIDSTHYVGKFTQAQVTGFDFTLDNQRSLVGVLGSKFSPGVFDGQAKVTGNITYLYSSTSNLGFFENETVLSWAVKATDPVYTSNFYSISFYKVKFTAADMDPPQNGPVILSLPFEALEGTFAGDTVTYREVMHVQRTTP